MRGRPVEMGIIERRLNFGIPAHRFRPRLDASAERSDLGVCLHRNFASAAPAMRRLRFGLFVILRFPN